MPKTLLHNAMIVTGEACFKGAVLIDGERIGEVFYCGQGAAPCSGASADEGRVEMWKREAGRVIDLKGKILMAGGIDAHVHFREPGLTGKADMESESAAAVAGGVTSFIDMPNTNPVTVTMEAVGQKVSLAQGRCRANYAFHIGATNSNADEILAAAKDSPDRFGGIKVFMGSSTGNMLVDRAETLEKIFSVHGKPVLVHCEDEGIIRENLVKAVEKYSDGIPMRLHMEIRSREACLKSSESAVSRSLRHGTALHLLHVSTEDELELIRKAKKSNPSLTAETSVNYLWFCAGDYDRLGALIKCNPSIKTEKDRKALREALKNGLIDTIGTDHAPHKRSEKDGCYTRVPSGMPSIQHSLPVLLTVAAQEDIPLTRIASVFSEKAAEIFRIKDRGYVRKGCFADLVAVDPEAEFTVQKSSLLYKCGWSPYEGCRLKGRVETVFVNGHTAFEDGAVTDGAYGERLFFE